MSASPTPSWTSLGQRAYRKPHRHHRHHLSAPARDKHPVRKPTATQHRPQPRDSGSARSDSTKSNPHGSSRLAWGAGGRHWTPQAHVDRMSFALAFLNTRSPVHRQLMIASAALCCIDAILLLVFVALIPQFDPPLVLGVLVSDEPASPAVATALLVRLTCGMLFHGADRVQLCLRPRCGYSPSQASPHAQRVEPAERESPFPQRGAVPVGSCPRLRRGRRWTPGRHGSCPRPVAAALHC